MSSVQRRAVPETAGRREQTAHGAAAATGAASSIKGPAIFLAQFLRDHPPYNSLDAIGAWVAGLGYRGIQIPPDPRVFDLERAAASKTYCEDYRGRLAALGLEPTEVSGHIFGQVLALHPAYEEAFQPFYPAGLRGRERAAYAAAGLRKTIRASANLGLDNIPAMSGGFAWHLVYPWPQRPGGLIEEAFTELARLWRPLLDLARDDGICFTFELHPGSDVYDGATFETFLERVGGHAAACINYDPSHFVLQQLDYLEFIRLYGDRIKAFHVKDAEFRPSGRVGVYGGYQSWAQRAGRFRSLGDGQVDFRRVFTLLTEAGFRGWAVLEWECCVKSPEQGAAEGAPFIARHLIEATQLAFDDFAGAPTDRQRNRRLLGLE
ncbi:MAG: sugar phosphate isomerase/epimerase [Candidatus Latescibacterota bacterium]